LCIIIIVMYKAFGSKLN